MLLFAGLVPNTTDPDRANDIVYHGEQVTLYARILTDWSSTNLPLPSGVSSRFEITLNDPSFYMFSKDTDAATKGYRLAIDNATMQIPVRQLSSGLSLDMEKKMTENPLVYNLRRIEEKRFEVPPGVDGFGTDALVTGSVLPDRVLVLVITSKVSSTKTCFVLKQTVSDLGTGHRH